MITSTVIYAARKGFVFSTHQATEEKGGVTLSIPGQAELDTIEGEQDEEAEALREIVKVKLDYVPDGYVFVTENYIDSRFTIYYQVESTEEILKFHGIKEGTGFSISHDTETHVRKHAVRGFANRYLRGTCGRGTDNLDLGEGWVLFSTLVGV